MNIAQAKQISIESFLQRLGYEPVANKKGQLWYLSPFRHETEPSFKVNPAMNAWYDFAEGAGGDIVEFVKRHFRVSSVREALESIRRIQGSDPLPKQVALPLAQRREQPPATDIESIGPVRSKALLTYLKQRHISIPLAASRVQEAHYRCGEKSYFGLAFANDSGGYELRNPMFKGTLGTKDITTIPMPGSTKVSVFERFFDYLSAVTLNRGSLDHSAIILNSVSFRDRAVEKIRSLNASRVELYRDNDTAGLALLDYFEKELPSDDVVDMAGAYRDYNDLNAQLVDRSSGAASKVQSSRYG